MSPARPVTVTVHTRRGLLILMVAVVITAPVGGWVLGANVNSNEVRIDDVAALTAQIQHERVRNTVKACERRNTDHRLLVAFFTGLVPREKRMDPKAVKFVKRSRKAFPITDCHQQAREQVKSPKP